MKVGIIQSSYIPWRGYFDLIASVDTFVLYDDIQYSKEAGEIEIGLKHLKELRG